MKEKHKLFCEHYCRNGFNGTQAALSAGYGNGNPTSAKTKASMLINREDVKAYVAEFRAAQSHDILVTTTDVVIGLLEEARNQDGTASARVAAWKTLGDYTGGFDANKQKVEHTGNIEFNRMSDEELDERLRKLIG